MPLFFMKAFLLCAVVKDQTKLDGHQCCTSAYCGICLCMCVCYVDNWANKFPDVSSDLWPFSWQKAGGASSSDASVLFPQDHLYQKAEQRKHFLNWLSCSEFFRCGRARSADAFVDVSHPIWAEMSSGRRIRKRSDLLHHLKTNPSKEWVSDLLIYNL